VVFEAMDNAVGAVRARCLLARALAAAGLQTEAEQLVHETERRLQQVRQTARDAFSPLKARLRWAKGEVLLARGDTTRGRQILIETATRLSEHRDWTSHAEIMRRLSHLDQASRDTVAES